MKAILKSGLSFVSFIFIALSAAGCVEMTTLDSRILSLYRNRNFPDYNIKKIALIPMANDDTTDTGTFYSTSHFLDLLNESFAGVQAEVPQVDSLIRADTSLIPHLFESIRKNRKLDLLNPGSERLIDSLSNAEYDAMIIGSINSYKDAKEFVIQAGNRLLFKATAALTTSCDFTYFMISLKDGSILWGARILGIDANYDNDEYMRDYPPLDSSISNGIDVMINTLPFERVIQPPDTLKQEF